MHYWNSSFDNGKNYFCGLDMTNSSYPSMYGTPYVNELDFVENIENFSYKYISCKKCKIAAGLLIFK